MEQRGYFCCQLDSTTKYSAIHELFVKAEILHKITKNQSQLENIVICREQIESTGFGNGIAVAHGKSHIVDGFAVILGVSEQGIEYDSIDGKPVHFLFMIVHPPEMEKIYLDVLSRIFRLFKHVVKQKVKIQKMQKILKASLKV